MHRSLVYTHIFTCLLVMNSLYGFGYRHRSTPVADDMGQNVNLVVWLESWQTRVQAPPRVASLRKTRQMNSRPSKGTGAAHSE